MKCGGCAATAQLAWCCGRGAPRCCTRWPPAGKVAEQKRIDVSQFEKAALARNEAQLVKVAQAEQSGTVTDRFAGFPSTLRALAVLPVMPLALLTVGEMDPQPHTATV